MCVCTLYMYFACMSVTHYIRTLLSTYSSAAWQQVKGHHLNKILFFSGKTLYTIVSFNNRTSFKVWGKIKAIPFTLRAMATHVYIFYQPLEAIKKLRFKTNSFTLHSSHYSSVSTVQKIFFWGGAKNCVMTS